MIECTVYRSPKKPETYLYLSQELEPSDLPEALLQQFGEPLKVMELSLEPGRRLARADVNAVMKALAEPGYYLQLPPVLGSRKQP